VVLMSEPWRVAELSERISSCFGFWAPSTASSGVRFWRDFESAAWNCSSFSRSLRLSL
jgi:hypothetical protein